MALREVRTLTAPPAVGLYGRDRLTMDEYLSFDAVSSGLVKDVLERTPRYADARRRVRSEESTHTERGTAIHCAILEPHDFDLRYESLPEDCDLRTNRGKDAKATIVAKGKHPLPAATMEACVRLRERAWEHPAVRDALEQAETETTGIFECDNGLVGKVRADVLARGAETVIDLKSTVRSADPSGFGRVAADGRFDISHVWYCDGFTRAGCKVSYWHALALELDPDHGHYDVALYTIADPVVLARARHKVQMALDTWAISRSRGTFAGYSQAIVPLQFPGWFYKE
jgi:hypothetical protein